MKSLAGGPPVISPNRDSRLLSAEDILAKTNSVKTLFNGNPQFEKVFSSAQKAIGTLENAWIQECPGIFDTRKSIMSIVKRIEIIESYFQHGVEPKDGGTLKERLERAKKLLSEVNVHLNG